jgi:hypothetical protein
MPDTISTSYDQMNLLDGAVPAETVAWIRQVADAHPNWSSNHIKGYLARKHVDVTAGQVKQVLGR